MCDSNGSCVHFLVTDTEIVDYANNLAWEKAPSEGFFNWAAAGDHCSAKGAGWRIPNIDELRSIVVGCSYTETGGSCPARVGCGPTVNECYNAACVQCVMAQGAGNGGLYLDKVFSVPATAGFWSNTHSANNGIFWLEFGSGDIGINGADGAQPVWCVHSVVAP